MKRRAKPKNSRNNGLATKKDMESLKSGLTAKIESVESGLTAKIESVETGLSQKIDSVEKRLDQKIDSVEKRLDQKIDKVAMNVIQLKGDLEKTKEDLRSEMQKGFDRVVGIVDHFAGRMEMYDRETITFPHVLDEHGKKIGDHEKRIAVLEEASHR